MSASPQLPRRPEVVAFDLGKVLLDFDYNIAATRLSSLSRLTPEEMRHLLDHSPLLFRYETGKINRAEFFAEVKKAADYRGSPEEFAAAFADIFVPIEPMIELNRVLRRQQVPTFIFSNTNDIAITHIRQAYPFFAEFDGYILSYEHGSMKPEPAIYSALEKLSGHSTDAVLYLDDRQENVEAGAKRGWQTHLQRDPAESWAVARRLGLLANR